MGVDGPGVAGRPLVWVNCAVSLDGRLAFAGGKRAPLSSPEDLVRVHRLRAASDAILVGVGTVIADDPSLRVRWELVGTPPARPPARVIVDSGGRVPAGARVLDGSVTTIVATTERNRTPYPETVERLVAGPQVVDLGLLLSRLHERGMRQLMVEGGAEVLGSFLRSRLFDRLSVYYAPVVIGGQTAPPMVGGRETPGPAEMSTLQLDSLDRLGPGFVATFVP